MGNIVVHNSTFYLCLNLHQQSILKHKGISAEIVNMIDLEYAYDQGIKKYVILNDTLPVFFRIVNINIVDVELWQEGLIPFLGINYNARSFIRSSINQYFNFNFTRGYRPYFFNGIKKIKTAFDPDVLKQLGVQSEIQYDPNIIFYNDSGCDNAMYPIYLSTNFYSSGMMSDHVAQMKSFFNLLKVYPQLKFRPHPSEVYLFKNLINPERIELNYKYSNFVIGTISTLLYVNNVRGAHCNVDLRGFSDIVKRAFYSNVISFLPGCVIENDI